MAKLRRDVEAAVNANRMEDAQAGRLLKFYEEALQGYTYLEDPNAD
jgi:arginine decarboxylase